MWYRLKSSLLTAAVATMLVLGFLTVAQPVDPAPPPKGPLMGLTGLDIEQERVAFQVAVALTALAIDAAVESRERGEPAAHSAPEATPGRGSTSIRMPFYSFAAKPARESES